MLGGDASCDMAWDDMERLEGLEGLREFCARRTKKFTVSVEGNIGCGKSTLLKYFESCPTVECLKEPVDQWRDIQGHNALQLLYEDPKRWAFSFDNYSMLTRLEMHRHKHQLLYEEPTRWTFSFNNFCQLTRLHMHTHTPAVPVKMLERSLFSTRYVFVENSHKSGMLTDLEFAVLSEWFDFITTTQKVGVDLFVYLKAPPDVCHRRIMARNRKEESGVPLDFIEKLHDLHEDWLINQKKYKVPGPVLVLDASHELPKMKEIYEEFKSEILCGCT